MNRHVAVIGAGIVGAMCALEAAAAGLRVTLIDPAEPGAEHAASYGNAGWFSSQSVIPPAEPGIWKKIPGYLADPLGPLAIRPLYLPRIAPWLVRYMVAACTRGRVEKIAGELRCLLQDAAKLHGRVAEQAGLAHLVRPDSGLMHVYRSRQQFLDDGLAWGIRRRAGIEWRELSEAELRSAQPGLSHEYRFALVVPEGGHCVDPGAYVAGLVRHAAERGVHLIRARASGFRFDGDRLLAVRLPQGDMACDAAVIAAGAFSAELGRAAGSNTPLETERGYHVEYLGANDGPTAMPIMVADRKLIVTMTRRGARVAGQVELAGLHAAPDWRRADVLKTVLHDLFPAMSHGAGAANLRYWMGHRPSSPDGKPYIGASRGSADVILAYGHGHVGLGSSARTGRVVAQLLTGQETEIDLEPFSPDRHAVF